MQNFTHFENIISLGMTLYCQCYPKKIVTKLEIEKLLVWLCLGVTFKWENLIFEYNGAKLGLPWYSLVLYSQILN